VSAPDEALSKRRLRLWLRLLRTTRAAEAALREHLRLAHGTTLPRFDVMAALHRAQGPLTMTELSRQLLVSNGNATAVVDRLEAEGLVRRAASPADRRAVQVALTPEGAARFMRLAADHEARVNGLFEALGPAEIAAIGEALKRLETREERA
jgi:DNA-binding MarR family transcriptional regulator